MSKLLMMQPDGTIKAIPANQYITLRCFNDCHEFVTGKYRLLIPYADTETAYQLLFAEDKGIYVEKYIHKPAFDFIRRKEKERKIKCRETQKKFKPRYVSYIMGDLRLLLFVSAHSQDVADEIIAGKRYEMSHEKIMRYYEVASIDSMGNLEGKAFSCKKGDPVELAELADELCCLCRALNSLPEIQGRRVDAYYVLGLSMRDIAGIEGVSISSVSESIAAGIKNMRKYFCEHYVNSPELCPKNLL